MAEKKPLQRCTRERTKISIMEKKKLYRSNARIIAGVCGGIAEYLGIDETLVRILYLIFSIFFLGILPVLLYIAMAFVMPSKPNLYDKSDYRGW